ncbi:NAD(+) synthase [Meiothermus granaticius]|uniref:NH(3)-dependent NAD(+) synthetase n=1 Tax=Meiothermus granaticius NBRC 107808 TaxID=1227551 RepID=A0A399F8K5_9DEIN|nr:NAD(+) synthase [Meiothermus granaticius]RIH92035.1 NH(3)-dependent NAD(+) synthetase [Meiothermus granaticius NBRC 107808]GEM86897.1 NH(3)-dependent NAD(+) synthetase [Meiothermus granaticius NBRC 107808]
MRVIEAVPGHEVLELNYPLVAEFLQRFLREELGWRGFHKAVVASSGGVDSALTVALAARALGPENVYTIFMPHAISRPESREHAELVAQTFGVHYEVVDITAMVEGYAQQVPGLSARRKGNVMARARTIVGFDKSEEYGALHLGTGNKTERLFGYYTWHDVADTGPINPLGDLYKTQVWGLAEHLGVPEVVRGKPPTADLEVGQTDESDLGIAYRRADVILEHYLKGYPDAYIVRMGYSEAEVERVKRLVNRTHWKRHLPAVAVVSTTAIHEFYLRPLDFRLG